MADLPAAITAGQRGLPGWCVSVTHSRGRCCEQAKNKLLTYLPVTQTDIDRESKRDRERQRWREAETEAEGDRET